MRSYSQGSVFITRHFPTLQAAMQASMLSDERSSCRHAICPWLYAHTGWARLPAPACHIFDAAIYIMWAIFGCLAKTPVTYGELFVLCVVDKLPHDLLQASLAQFGRRQMTKQTTNLESLVRTQRR